MTSPAEFNFVGRKKFEINFCVNSWNYKIQVVTQLIVNYLNNGI